MTELSVSIVTYSPSLTVLAEAVQSLLQAAELAGQRGRLDRLRLIIVDNGPGDEWLPQIKDLLNTHIPRDSPFISGDIISGQGNIGFGRGHNLAFSRVQTPFHLIMNSDVVLSGEAILNALEFLENHPETGALSPYALDGSGRQQLLCKRYPSLADLFIRGFIPQNFHRFFQKRLDRYEMRDLCTRDRSVSDISIISGCFMFFRSSFLEEIQGFSSQYFLYFEDFDLSLRLGRICKLAYVPEVKIIHYGGGAGNKGIKHILWFCGSACRFFRSHGWKIL